jgi:hypothetical protein
MIHCDLCKDTQVLCNECTLAPEDCLCDRPDGWRMGDFRCCQECNGEDGQC